MDRDESSLPCGRRWRRYLPASYTTLLVGTLFLSLALGRPCSVLLENFSPFVMAEALAIFTLSRALLERPGGKDGFCGVKSETLARLSLGVYLVHPMAIDILEKGLEFAGLAIPAAIAVPALSVVTFAFSLLVASLLGRIPLFHRLGL